MTKLDIAPTQSGALRAGEGAGAREDRAPNLLALSGHLQQYYSL